MTLHLGTRTARHALRRLKLVRIRAPLPRNGLDAFKDKVRGAFLGIIRDIDVIQYDLPAVETIEARLLTRSLDAELGGHILGITEADLLDRTGNDFWGYMFGGKDDSNDVAVVSTRRLTSRTSELTGARLLKVALHELGHNFGLTHHYDYSRAGDDTYCPMTKGDFNRFGERAYVRAVIDARGYRFCRSCRRFLRHHYA